MDADSGAHAGLDTPASGATPVPSPPASSGDAKAPPVAFSSGLTSSQAAELLSVHGKNELAESHKSKLRLLLEQARVSSRNNRRHNISRLAQFTAPMPCVIWCAVIIELALAIKYGQTWTDFGVLFGIQLLNGAISFHEASSADDAVSALRASLKSSAVVKRDGAWREAPAGDLVLGDLVKLVAGCTAPADCVLNGGHCEVDQSALTGESLPVPLDRGGEVMMSSTVVRGEAEATVVRTGASTFLGKTAGMISGTMSRPRFHAVLLRIMSALITVSAVVCFTVLGFLLDNERLTFEEAISIFVILLVVSVPLALTVVTTSTMAQGSNILAREGAIVTHLAAIEELAGVNMLCSDKTGTLTLNQMALQDEAPLFDGASSQREVLLYAALASHWLAPPKDAIDTLVLGAADASALAGYEMLHYSPFDAAVKRTESTVRETASGRVLRASKGAAGAVASLISGPGADDQLRALHQAADTLAARGMRSLAVARADGAGSDGGAWALCGLLTFVDPPRPDTAETLRRVGAMGVSVKMVTGDAAAIAVETARRLGIGTNIVPSNGLPELVDGKPPPDLDRFAPMIVAADGFAQVVPEHKFLIVEALRRAGFAVAMTGDGVNDSPALKRADVGVAVQGATDAARAAADIVLTRPGLSTILTAITTSRQICLRVQVYITYRVACTVQVLLFFFIAIVAFQPVLYASGSRGGANDNVLLAEFGPGGKPNGALVMYASPRCLHRTWYLGDLSAAVGAAASRGVTAASLAGSAFAAASGVQLDASADSVAGPVCIEQWPRTFMLPLLALIFITIANDGAVISIARDRVRAPAAPVQWRLARQTLVALVLAGVMLASSLTYLHLMLSSHAATSTWRSSFSLPQVCAAIYLQLSLANVFTLFSARTAGFFCTGAPPAAVMLFALSLAMIFAALMSAYWPAHLNEHVVLILDASAFRSRAQYTEVHTRVGVRMVGCPPYLIGFTFVYVLVWWAIQDTAKVLLQQLLARADAGTVPGAGLAAPPPGAGRSGKAGTDRPGAPVVLMAEP